MDILERLYDPNLAVFIAAVEARTPADQRDAAVADARRFHALRVASVTAAYEPYRLGKGKVGGGRFAKKGDIGIPLLRQLLSGRGSARTEIHKAFNHKHLDKQFGHGDHTPSNINKWATSMFGPRPHGQDGLAWDAGRRELATWHAALPARSRTPDVTPGDGTPNAPDPMVDWKPRTPTHKLATQASYDKPELHLDHLNNPPDVVKNNVSQGDGSKEFPYVTGDVNAAAYLLGQDQHVRLESERQVSTLLDKLHAEVQRMKAAGEKAPVFDLCKVTVPGTNLFCAESKGIPRIQMPQLGGVPIPGSKADSLPKNADGAVDLSGPFIDWLQGKGIAVRQNEVVPADVLKASQSELNGGKIVGMMAALEAGTLPEAPIFVSRDDYVVDGHHRWAANVGMEYKDGEQMNMPVHVVDADIIDVLALANTYALEMGIPQASAAQMVTGGKPDGPDVPTVQELRAAPGAGWVSGKSHRIGGTEVHRNDFGDGTVGNISKEPDGGYIATLNATDGGVLTSRRVDSVDAGRSFLESTSHALPNPDSAPGPSTSRAVNVDLPDGLAKNIIDGAGTKEAPYRTSDPTTAAHLLAKDQYVTLDAHPGQLSVVLDEVKKLAKQYKDADPNGDVPSFDLCKVTVPGTSLFCVESKGIPRIEMPQLSGVPIAGSKADALPKDGEGKVNITSLFPGWLAERGITVTPGSRKVKEMRPTQSELNGGKTAGIMQGWRDVRDRGIHRDPNAPEGVNQFITSDGEVIDGIQADRLAGLTDSLFVDRDGYIVDGHHRWAGAMGADVEFGGDADIEMSTLEISDNVDIIEVIALANQFTLEMGIPPAGVGQGAPPDIPTPTVQEMASPPAPHTVPSPGSKPLVMQTDVLARYGINPGDVVHARYDQDGAEVDVMSPLGVRSKVIPWFNLGLPDGAASTQSMEQRPTNGISFAARPGSQGVTTDEVRVGAGYNPRSPKLAELANNQVTRLQIADALEKNPPDAGTAAFLRQVQTESQAALRAKGLDTVVLWRGRAGRQDTPFPTDGTGLTSWTTDPAVAAEYVGQDGTLFRAEIPVDQILSWDVLGALRSQSMLHDSQPGQEVLVAADRSTSDRISSGVFPFVASAASDQPAASFNPRDVFFPKPQTATAPAVDVPAPSTPDVVDAAAAATTAVTKATEPKGVGGLFSRLRGGRARSAMTASELLGGDMSPENIRKVLKRGDLSDVQREELNRLLGSPVVAALALASVVEARRAVERREQALALARSIADRVVE